MACGDERAGTGDPPPAPQGDLAHVLRLAVPLDEAFLLLARYQEERTRNAAALLERETWTLTTLLARSEPPGTNPRS